MDVLIPLLIIGLSVFGAVAWAALHESRDGFERTHR
jgi:hypothetical protein